MAGNAHCHCLRHARPHHVANGCPAKVMEDAAHILQFVAVPIPRAVCALVIGIYCALAFWANQLPKSGHNASRRPSLAEIANRLTVAMEDQGGQHHGRIVLFNLARGPSPFDHFGQFALDSHGASFAIFGVLRAKPDHVVVNIFPSQGPNLTLAPAGEVSASGEVLQILRQILNDSAKLWILEKALAFIAFFRQVTNHGTLRQPLAVNRQAESLCERLRDTIDGRRRIAFGKPLFDVLINLLRTETCRLLQGKIQTDAL